MAPADLLYRDSPYSRRSPAFFVNRSSRASLFPAILFSSFPADASTAVQRWPEVSAVRSVALDFDTRLPPVDERASRADDPQHGPSAVTDAAPRWRSRLAGTARAAPRSRPSGTRSTGRGGQSWRQSSPAGRSGNGDVDYHQPRRHLCLRRRPTRAPGCTWPRGCHLERGGRHDRIAIRLRGGDRHSGLDRHGERRRRAAGKFGIVAQNC